MPTSRLRSLDVFRGLTVAAMVLVNSPGTDAVYAPFQHAAWDGCTPTDLIFPAFLVIMGVSAAFARADIRRALTRALLMIALGLIENAFIYRGPAGMRYPGVLQRIALCWLGVETVRRLDSPAAEFAAISGLLAGYWALLVAAPLTPDGNLAYWLDRRLFAGHLMTGPSGDPEGLLATLPALATALLGLVAGRQIAARRASAARALAVAGLALACLGAAWSLVFPMNKHLWTSSYALFTGGLSLAGLAACLKLCGESPPAWTRPLEALGRHALATYIAAGAIYGVLEFENLKEPATALLFGRLPPPAASLAFASVFTATALLVAQRFDRRQQ